MTYFLCVFYMQDARLRSTHVKNLIVALKEKFMLYNGDTSRRI